MMSETILTPPTSRRRRRRQARMGSSSIVADRSPQTFTRRTAMACLLVAAVCSTTCLSFTVPRQRTRSLQRHDSTLFEQPTLNGSSEESVSGNCEMLPVVDDDYDETSSPPAKNPAFQNAAESPAPPLNFEKYLTMQVSTQKTSGLNKPNTPRKSFPRTFFAKVSLLRTVRWYFATVEVIFCTFDAHSDIFRFPHLIFSLSPTYATNCIQQLSMIACPLFNLENLTLHRKSAFL